MSPPSWSSPHHTPRLCCHGAHRCHGPPPICAVKGPVSPLCCAMAPHWLFTPGPARISALRSQSIPPSPSPPASTVSSLCLSSALQMGSSVSFFQILCMCINIQNLFFSFNLLSVTVSRFIFYELGQIYNDTYLSFRVQGIFRALKILYTIKYLLKTKLTFISSSPKISFH